MPLEITPEPDEAEREAGFSASVRKPIDPLLFVRAVAEVSLRA
jgi:hypothetical protein